jgi:uncharacterized protein
VIWLNQEIINKIKEEIYQRCIAETNTYGIGAWTHHIKVVYDLAVQNHILYNADLEIVSLAALLHDIASVTNVKYTENHHIIGAQIADQLLRDLGYDEDKLKIVKNCILNHRGSVLRDKQSNEEICVADADAMTHFYNVPSLLSMVYKEKNMGIDEGAIFVYEKLQRSYNKLSDCGKNIIKPQYEASKLVLKAH